MLIYRTADLDGSLQGLGGLQCVTCHTLPAGIGPDLQLDGALIEEIPPGPNGERHHSLVSVDGSTNVSMKVPQLRSLYEKVGFEMTQTTSRAGFGFLHDGSVDSLARFMSEPPFIFDEGIDGPPDMLVTGMVAFMLSFSGSNLPMCQGVPSGPCGSLSQDTHAAVGTQLTVDVSNKNDPATIDALGAMSSLVDAGPGFNPGPQVALVARGRQAGLARGYSYTGGGVYQSDRAAETIDAVTLRSGAGTGSELSFTLVPAGTQTRIGIDRDEDDALDRDERDACSDPADAASLPGADVAVPLLRLDRSGSLAELAWPADGASWDVVAGNLDMLRASGDFTTTTLACLADDAAVPTATYDDALGVDAVFFLVRAACAGGTTYESGGAGQEGLRDAEVDAAPGSCPGP